MNAALGQCSLPINTTLPLVCICSLFSFLCGVGIGANDLSANFAMVVGSGSLNMKQAIIYCSVFELLGAAFMGGHVSSTIRNGIVQPELFRVNRDVVVIGMTAASFAAALWLYLSTVFGLPVSITHTVVGSLLGYAVFSTFSFTYVKTRGLVVIVISWVVAPLAACVVTAVIFFYLRRDVFHVKGRSFELALKVLPLCLATSLLVDFAFVVIEQPPIMTQTFALYVPVWTQFVLLFGLILFFCYASWRWYFPHVAGDAWASTSFVWESRAIRTETVDLPAAEAHAEDDRLDTKLSFFRPPQPSSSTTSSSSSHSGEVTDARSMASTVSVHDTTAPTTGREEEEQEAATQLATEQTALLHRGPRVLQEEAHGDNSLPPLSINLAPGSSVVLSSINPSDSRVLLKGTVRLAPTGRRSPLPSVSGRESDAAASERLRHAGSGSHSATPSSSTTTRSGLFRPPAFLELEQPTRNTSVVFHRDVSRRSNGRVAAAAAGYGATEESQGSGDFSAAAVVVEPFSPTSVHSEDEFGDEDWALNHPMQPIRFGGLLIKPFNPRAEFLFTSLQVVAGSMSSFVHGAVAGANATATFVILYEAFTNHELGETDLGTQWSVLPAMLGIAIGMFALGASLMKTVGMELVTVTPARGWCIQVGGTTVTMVLTGLGIPVSLSQSQVGAAIGCGVLDAKLAGVSWPLVGKIVGGWVVTLVISAVTTGIVMWLLFSILC